MIELLIVLAIVTLFLLLVGTVVLPILVWEFVHFRRSVWITVSPGIVPLEPEHLPPVVAPFVGEVRPVLDTFGLRLAAIAHAPEFGANTTWTQVMFLNRERGERAAVECFIDGNQASIALTFVAEFTNGIRVTTDSTEDDSIGAKAVPLEGFDAAGHARRLYELHRKRVDDFAATHPGLGRAMPAEGDELTWIRDKASAVAADFADGRFEPERSGQFYRPTRKHALRLVYRSFTAFPVRRPTTVRGFPINPSATR